MSDICLQINLCPGDVAYAERTVPRLLAQHPDDIAHRMLIVDTNKPQRTRANQRDYPEPEFSEKANQIQDIAKSFQSQGLIDEIVKLNGKQTELQCHLSKKFSGGWIPPHITHDYHGAAYLAYLAAIDLCPQRYLLHYDADILMYQQAGTDWVQTTLSYWDKLPDAIVATPRIAPPGHTPDAPSEHQGRPYHTCEGGWLDDWFSTRCFLMDTKRLDNYLPLVKKRYLLEVLFYRILKRRYPPAPEILLFRSAGASGARRLNLSDQTSWLLHPTEKPERFLRLLPELLQALDRGSFPPEQTGQSEINLAAWENFLK
ncbi:MAG: hypothetical protein AAF571_00915 [Verrucomicrobiota bacterium]